MYVRENGRTLAEARGELGDIAPRARFTLELAGRLDESRELPAGAGRTLVRPAPFGVVIGIVPWNAPVSLGCMQLVPALLAGNAVVMKPPESCPLTFIATARMLAAALPSGLLNIVTGLPGEIGDRLTTHPSVGKIAFTGSIPSARKILCNAAQSIKSVTSELGGNDPAILLDDVSLDDRTMDRMAGIVFRLAGQICMAIKRIYVPADLHDHFVEAFGRAVDRIVVGNGLDDGVTMGPLHSPAALERAQAILADAVQRGANIKSLGRYAEQVDRRGSFMRPTIVTDVPEDARIVQEEQFCPAIPILRHAGIDDAVRRANGTIFGLGGSCWGRNISRATAVARRIEAGTVFVNTHGTNSVNRQAPYGGVKQSGVGRRAGIEGVLEYSQLQTLTTFEE